MAGTYAFVNMASKHTAVAYGSRGTLTSPVYNPTPPYSSNPKNPFYQSCQVRSHFYSIITNLVYLKLQRDLNRFNDFIIKLTAINSTD